MSELLRKSIIKAFSEDRLKAGLFDCINFLYINDPSKILTVALTDSQNDLMSQTILETYCFENKIPFIKTDSHVLKRFLRFTLNEDRRSESYSCCVLILVSFELNLIVQSGIYKNIY
jgi:hypothetical protein